MTAGSSGMTPESSSEPVTVIVADDQSAVNAARVTLRGSAAVKGHPGGRQYTRLTAVFPHKRPTVYKVRHGKVVATHPQALDLPHLTSPAGTTRIRSSAEQRPLTWPSGQRRAP